MSRIARTVTAASARIDSVCLFLAKAALVGMVAVIMVQIVSRYGLRQPPVWTEELARYLMVWGGLLGATAAFRRATDPAVVRVNEQAGDRRALLAKLAIAATALVFIAPVLWFSLVGQNFDLGRSFLMRMSARTSAGLGINLAFIAAAIPTACIVILIHLWARLIGGPLPPRSPEPQ